MDERGQVLPLVALALVAMAGVAGIVARVGRATVAREQAATAADAAALAAAGGAGASGAARLAQVNGARVVRYEASGSLVRVTVERDGATATARARRGRAAPGLPPARRSGAVAAGSPAAAGLDPALRGALARAGEALGTPVPVVSGFRTHDEQTQLWAQRASNPYPVARPGTSAHERGRAVDVPLWFVGRLVPVAAGVGLCQPYPRTDPVHFELCGGG